MAHKGKNLLLIFALLGFMISSACHEQDVVEPEVQYELTGTWILTGAEASDCNDASENTNGSETLECTSQACYRMRFDQNGGFAVITVENGEAKEQLGNYFKEEDLVMMNIDGVPVTARYDLEKEHLTLNLIEGTEGCDVKFLLIKD